MKKITTHQNSFLPYIGFWWKVINSDIFIINEASRFSLTSMYYRTYMNFNIKDFISQEIKYLTVLIDRENCENLDIKMIKLKPESISKLKSQFISIFSNYKNLYPNLNKKILNDLLFYVQDYEYLYQLNNSLFNFVYNYLDLKTKILINHDANFYNVYDGIEKTDRLINQLKEFDIDNDKKIYISGSSGRHYVDINKFKQSNYILNYQTEIDSNYYHGSILHYIFTMSKDEIIDFINSKFILKEN